LRGRGRGMHGGTAWGTGSFDSNGEQIYFTGVNESGSRMTYEKGPVDGMMMGGFLACASCHGPDARGGRHVMHMQVMDAPDIRWSVLASEEEAEHGDDEHEHQAEYSFESFRQAVVGGEHPDGDPLSDDMPRWNISDEDLIALMDYLKSIP
jgi:cytochrome c oxidase subunit 2